MTPARHVSRRSAAFGGGWASPRLSRTRLPKSGWAIRGGYGCSVLAGALLALLAAGGAAGQPPGQPRGLFQAVAPAGLAAVPGPETVSDSITLRRRLVAIDFAQLSPAVDVTGAAASAASASAAAAPSGVLTLNLFDDASFTGLVESVAPTFSGGYSLAGPLAGVEMGTMTLVVNGDVVAGTVRTPEATYRIRPAAGGLHAVSEVDLSRLPPLGEPIPRYREEDDLRRFEPGRGGLPVPR